MAATTLRSRMVSLALAAGLAAALSGCGAAPEVKSLSTAQLGYFETALAAVRAQSEALLVAADRIKADAEAAILRLEEAEKSDFAKSVAADVSAAPAGQREAVVRRYMESANRTLAAGAESRARLEAGRAAIAAKSAELQAFLAKMRDVQRALDAYIQSEQAGERVLREVLEQPTVAGLLGTANALVPRVTQAAEELKRLIAALPAAGRGSAP